MTTVTLKGNKINIYGDLPKVGTRAPDFKLVDVDLGEKTLGDYKGKKKLLNIVPSLDTPTCALSTKKFNDFAKTRSDAVILIISADLPFAQKRFCGNENLQNVVSLSLMRGQNFAKEYGLLIQDGPLAGITTRAVVVIDENDKVVYTELVPEIVDEPNYEKALAALK